MVLKLVTTQTHLVLHTWILIHGLQHRYMYMMRTIPIIKDNSTPLENVIRPQFVQALFNGYVCNDTERKLFVVPVRFGSLGILLPTERC